MCKKCRDTGNRFYHEPYFDRASRRFAIHKGKPGYWGRCNCKQKEGKQ